MLSKVSLLLVVIMMKESVRDRITAVSFYGTARLDPRLKLLMLIALGCVSFFVNGDIPELILMIAAAAFVCAGSATRWGLKMLIVYIVISYLNTCLKYVSVPGASLLMGIFGVTILKMLPIVTLAKWVLKSTYMDELAVALAGTGMPQTVIIPFVVMFRYIPTLGIEYRMIRNTMKIRGVCDSVLKVIVHPFATIEYVLIPLLMRCLKVSDELAASGTTRGMERENKRSSILKIGFGFWEYFTAACFALFILLLLIMDRSKVGLYALWR